MIQNVLSIRHTTVRFDNICFEIALRIILRYGGETTPNDVSVLKKSLAEFICILIQVSDH